MPQRLLGVDARKGHVFGRHAMSDKPCRYTVLVTGGREYDNADALGAVLDPIYWEHPDMLLVSGGQRKWSPERRCYVGADHLAIEWALSREVDFNGRPARWELEGHPQAGPMRNTRQLE